MSRILKILVTIVLLSPVAVLQALAAEITFDNNSPTVALGSTFNVQIIANLSPGDELAGGIIDLGYDDSVVEILNVAIDPAWDFLPDSGSKIGAGQWNGIGFDVFVNDPVSANAFIAVITLETRGLGSAPLSILISSQFFSNTIEISPIITNAVITVIENDPPTEFFVSVFSGDDLFGDGSISDPWQTITHALSQIAVSAEPVTIRITDDTYPEDVFIDMNGAVINLIGGCDENFQSCDTTSVIQGTLEFGNATVIVENIVLEP